MFKLVSNRDAEEKWTFVVGKKYSVGRKNADVVLDSDTSVSRNHASIEVDHPPANWGNPSLLPTLNITDTSKFGTFVCTGSNSDMRQVNLRETECLLGGNRLRFGRQWNEFSVEYTPLVVTTSTLNLNDTQLVKEYVGKLGGHLVKDWHDSCDFVVMSSVTLTTKAVSALLKGIHIVTPDYFRQYYIAAEMGARINLDPKNFEPPFAESAISSANVNLEPDPKRANLFGGKIFVFASTKQQRTVGPTITTGGGTSMLLSNCSLDLLKSNDVVMFQPTPEVSQQAIAAQMNAYKSRGKRLIQEQEISLAAVYANVTKHCNPMANFSEHIFAAPFQTTQSQPESSQNKARILVPETQSPVNRSTPATPSGRSVVEESMNISADAESLISNDSPTTKSSKSIKVDTRIFEHSRTGPVKRGKSSPQAQEKDDDDDLPSAKRRCEAIDESPPVQSDYVRRTPHRIDLDEEEDGIRIVREIDSSSWSASKSTGSSSKSSSGRLDGGQRVKKDLYFGNPPSDHSTSMGETKLFSKESSSSVLLNFSPSQNSKAPEQDVLQSDTQSTNGERTNNHNSTALSVTQSEPAARPIIRCIISEYESNTVFPLTEEPIPKRSQTAATSSNNASKMKERNTQKTLSKLFMISDSEDEDDDEIPESCPQDVESEPQVIAESQKQPSLRRSPRKKGREETPDDVDVVPGTPEGSDVDDDPFPGLRFSSKKSSSSVPAKNKKRKLEEEEEDDDVSILPTVKIPTLSTAQLPTLPIETPSTSTRQSRRTNTQGTSQGKATASKQSNLSQWLQGGASQKRKPDSEDEMKADTQKKIKTEVPDEDVPVKLEELKIKAEPYEEEGDIKGVTPAPVFTTSMIIRESTKEARKPSEGSKGPNFKSFRKLYPFGVNNGNKSATNTRSKPVNRTFIAVAANNITDEALERFESSQMPQRESSPNFEFTEPRHPVRDENNLTRTKNRQGSDDHESIVVDVDVDVNAINTPSQNRHNNLRDYDPSDGLFDFD